MPYFKDLYQESGSAKYAKTDWLEAIGDYQPGGGESFSLENGEAVIQCRVPWNKARSFLRFVLGWSYTTAAYPYKLKRENPVAHPRFGWLTASSVTFAGYSPVGVEGVGTRVAGAYAFSLPVAKYAEMDATVRFTDKPWTFLADVDIPTVLYEPTRNTYFDPVPSIEIISAEGLNNIQFANGPATGGAIPAPFGTLMSKMTKTLNWMYVPHEYISSGLEDSGLSFNPNNIMACVGRVNSEEFLDHPAGTLLLQAPIFQRFRFPIQTSLGKYGYFGWNVRLPMQFFDPDRGGDSGVLTTRTDDDTGVVTFAQSHSNYLAGGGTVDVAWTGGRRNAMTVTGGGTTGAPTISLDGGTGDVLPAATTIVTLYDNRYRGHQLVPRRADLLWYGAKRELGGKLYPEAAYSRIFKHIADPNV